MPEYSDKDTHKDLGSGLGWAAKLLPFGLAGLKASPMVSGAVASLGTGLWAGNELGHYVDGLNGYGRDPETGKERDAFDLAAGWGMGAEDWVQRQLGAKEGDGSFADYVGGAVGGGVAGITGAIGGVATGVKDVGSRAAKLFHGLFD